MSGPRSNKRASILPLKPDYEDGDIPKIKHSMTEEVNGIAEKTQLEIFKLTEDASSHHFLTFLHQFREAMTTLNWTTGPKLFAKFPLYLEGDFRVSWDLLIDGKPRTVVSFNTRLTEFKNEQFTPDDNGNQMDYLREIKKPKEVKPKKCMQPLRSQNSMVKQQPGAPNTDAGFSDDEFKASTISLCPMRGKRTLIMPIYLCIRHQLPK